MDIYLVELGSCYQGSSLVDICERYETAVKVAEKFMEENPMFGTFVEENINEGNEKYIFGKELLKIWWNNSIFVAVTKSEVNTE